MLGAARAAAAKRGWTRLLESESASDDDALQSALQQIRLLTPVRLPSAAARFVPLTTTMLVEFALGNKYLSA
jgi:hypothetical protein